VSVDTKLCNDFKQFISLYCHVVVMFVAAFKELWTSTGEGKWQISWQGVSYRSIPTMTFSSYPEGRDICAPICTPFYM